ncbi:MAG: cyclic nucleotide-binding domain-containing protein [Pseudomonadota bacterium]
MKSLLENKTSRLKKKLGNSPYFREMPDKAFPEMAKLFGETSFSKGSMILKEDSRARRLFILLEGTVSLSLRRGGGDIVMEIIKKKGSLFGWSSLVPPKKYTATAKALENTRALTIQGKDMELFLKRHPSFGLLFFQKLSSLIATRLYHTRSLLADTMA